MRLIKCHIENFGNISNTDYDFNNDLTEYCEENGYGKTTLASFIRAMFYGLPTVRETAKDFNDRKRFYPFNGGKFGGNIVFETQGKEYKIERFFGKKSETEDSLAVYCNNKKYNGFGKEIGKNVFGLDQESFERTVFVTSDEIEIGATSSISAKLNNYVENMDSRNSVDSVIYKIEKADKELKASRGTNDLISKTKSDIVKLEASIKNMEKIEQNLAQTYTEYAQLKQTISQNEQDLEKIKNTNLQIERWEKYESLQARKDKSDAALKEKSEKYPHGLPNSEEISELKKSSKKIISLSGATAAAVFDADKQAKLDALTKTFSDGVPDDGLLKAVKGEVDEISKLDAQLAAATNQGRSARMDELSRKFSERVPDEKESAQLQNRIDEYRELENRQKAQQSVAAVAAPAPKKGKKGVYVTLMVLAAIIAAAGVGVLVANWLLDGGLFADAFGGALNGTALGGALFGLILGSALTGVGVLMLLITGIVLGVSRRRRPTVIIDETAIEEQAKMHKIENEAREFLTAYGYYTRNGIIFDFEIFKKDYQEYIDETARTETRDAELGELKNSREEHANHVKATFEKYGVADDDLQNAYVDLLNKVNVYKALQEDKKSVEKTQKSVSQDVNKYRASIEKIYGKYNIPIADDLAGQIDELSSTAKDVARLKKDAAEAADEMRKYKQKYGISEKPSGEVVDTAELVKQLNKDRNDLAILSGRISTDESEIEGRNDSIVALEAAQEKLTDYQYKHKILSAAVGFIKEADENLKTKYIEPIKDNFLQYANVIETTLGEKISMDQDFNIMFERNGENRSDKHLGAGQRSVCALCLRLALINNLYEDEKPFIIMDDPFVHLDENHFARTRNTVKALSKNNQIIYFTCHNSRKIEQ